MQKKILKKFEVLLKDESAFLNKEKILSLAALVSSFSFNMLAARANAPSVGYSSGSVTASHTSHGSHSSHGSHGSHGSHSTHASHSSHSSHCNCAPLGGPS